MKIDNEVLKPVLKDFLQSYVEKDDSVSDKEWLKQKLTEKAVSMTQEALEKYTQELVGGVQSYSATLDSLNADTAQGKTAEAWLEEKVQESGKALPVDEVAGIDSSLKGSNVRLLRELKAEEGRVNKVTAAEDIIAEQLCIDDFNNAAAEKGSRYEAAIDTSADGSIYGRNLFDIVIKDKFTGKKLENYQVKYGNTIAGNHTAAFAPNVGAGLWPDKGGICTD